MAWCRVTVRVVVLAARGVLDECDAVVVRDGVATLDVDLACDDIEAFCVVVVRGSVPTIDAVRAIHDLGLQRRVAHVGFDDVALADVIEPGTFAMYSVVTGSTAPASKEQEAAEQSPEETVLPYYGKRKLD